jgi:hypothetical protein
MPYLGRLPDSNERILLCPVVVDDRVGGLLYAGGLTAMVAPEWAQAIATALGFALGKVVVARGRVAVPIG